MIRFTFAYWCLAFAALLPIICAGLAKSTGFGKSRREGGFDNHHPREWLGKLSGWQARANAAQNNTFEALPFFFAAVIIAHQLQAAQVRLDILCFVWVMLRIFYIICYVGDMASARTGVWIGALVINFLILFIGFR
jgi:uncharacterized MAPEG superfamily protein